MTVRRSSRRAVGGTAAPAPLPGLARHRPGGARRRRLRSVAAVALCALLLTACAGTKDAVAQANTFTFVAPGGQTQIFYDPPATRGVVRGLSGDSLLEPGHTIGVDDFPGQVVVINIWGSWCGPCRAEAAGLEQTYQQTRASGVTLLGIDVRDDRNAAADFVREHAITYPSIFDNPGRSLLALAGFPRNTVPSTIVLDRHHRVAAVFLTALRVAELLPVVQRVAAEPADPAAAPAARGGAGS
ncbi:TlpA family protein disulfide reductase [Pseudonocardia sp. GCM10023141]|uniref:TlpA family protein disulfide reductase n=1 Tax=Pseudonocardia sp. GCM10023141 TaxID=3252653 RepID=UPI003614CADF